ncbi:MAG: helix-turn-helix domain-containing protein, partial [Calditrichae bacterium]|nr:helix-turn-helix domain-containing protein [Calditrichia bacterium]
MEDLKKELRDYEKLKSQKIPRIKITSLEQLPEALIRSRISHGYTQKQFALKLKMPEQQIQRYEAENYRAVSFETL